MHRTKIKYSQKFQKVLKSRVVVCQYMSHAGWLCNGDLRGIPWAPSEPGDKFSAAWCMFCFKTYFTLKENFILSFLKEYLGDNRKPVDLSLWAPHGLHMVSTWLLGVALNVRHMPIILTILTPCRNVGVFV